MPRHAHRHDEEIEDAKFGIDHDDGYDVRAHPTSKKAKEIKKPAESTRYVEEKCDVPRAMHGAIIGPKGAKLRELEAETNCKFDVPRREENSDSIYICGGEADVRKARKILEDLVKEAELLSIRRAKSGELAETAKAQTVFPTLPGDEKVVLHLDVEKFAHGKVIGTHATRLHDLKKRLVSQEHAVFDLRGVNIVVPLQDDVSQIISITMPKSLVPKAEKIVRDFFTFYEIGEHLKGIKVVDGLSMVGDSAPREDAKRQQGGGGAGGGAGGGRGRGRGRGGSDAAAPPAPPATAGAPPPAAPSPQPPAKESGAKAKAAPSPASPKAAASLPATPAATDANAASGAASRNQRKPRPAIGTLADLLATNGYTHRVIAPRTF